MCMNLVGGVCHATGRECLLEDSHQSNAKCALEGVFDIWIIQDGGILLSDIGPPSPEPKRSVALGVTRRVAGLVALSIARTTGSRIVTTQNECRQCESYYWITDHDENNTRRIGRRYLCPGCVGSLEKVVSAPGYWCG